MALFIQRYARNWSNAELKKALEANRVERNKPFLPRDDRTPRTILANYCAEFEFGEDKVDREMDWDLLILHAFQIGSHLPINPSTTHHNQKTIIFPTLLHLTLPKPTTSLESCLIILKFTIQLHTKHTPSPWSVYLLSAQHQQLQWLTLGLMSVLLAIL